MAVKKYEDAGLEPDEIAKLKEQQASKKPDFYGNSEDGKMLCPNCKEDLWDLQDCGFNFCPYCGQKLDWD